MTDLDRTLDRALRVTLDALEHLKRRNGPNGGTGNCKLWCNLHKLWRRECGCPKP